MKLTHVDSVGKIGDEKFISLHFDSDGREIKKNIRISGAAFKVAAKQELAYCFMKAIREAELDEAFMLFGDKWKEHFKGHDLLFAERVAKQAVSLRPDLFQ